MIAGNRPRRPPGTAADGRLCRAFSPTERVSWSRSACTSPYPQKCLAVAANRPSACSPPIVAAPIRSASSRLVAERLADPAPAVLGGDVDHRREGQVSPSAAASRADWAAQARTRSRSQVAASAERDRERRPQAVHHVAAEQQRDAQPGLLARHPLAVRDRAGQRHLRLLPARRSRRGSRSPHRPGRRRSRRGAAPGPGRNARCSWPAFSSIVISASSSSIRRVRGVGVEPAEPAASRRRQAVGHRVWTLSTTASASTQAAEVLGPDRHPAVPVRVGQRIRGQLGASSPDRATPCPSGRPRTAPSAGARAAAPARPGRPGRDRAPDRSPARHRAPAARAGAAPPAGRTDPDRTSTPASRPPAERFPSAISP